MFQRFILSLAIGAIGLGIASAQSPRGDNRYLNDSLPAEWRYLPERTMEIPSSTDKWWQSFDDPALDSLIAMGVENNYNLAMALHRTAIARNAMGQARSGYFPSVNLNAGWTKSRESGMTGSVPSQAMTMSYFSAGLSASWEIDIFGKIRSGVKAEKAGYMASRAEYAGAMVSMCAQIASAYVELRMYQAQLEIARAHSERQMKIVDIARVRFETELASKLDVAQALEVYYSTTASIPMLKNSIHTAISSLAVLTGSTFDTMNAMLGNVASLPNPTHLIATGVPADLLRRRPDIIEAEMQLAQYAARMGIAKKDFLPTLSLSGSIGTSAHNIGDLFSHDSFTYSIAPTLSWTLFDGLNRKYALASAKEEFMSAIDNYNLVVTTAVSEADNAMCTYFHSLQHVEAIRKMIAQDDEALRLAVERYKDSLSPMSDVVSAQLNSLSSESEMISAQGAALSALISLYEALGGGTDANEIISEK